MNPIRAATLSVANLEAAVSRYHQWLGYRAIETGLLDIDLAASLNAPSVAGARYTVLRPSSGRAVDLRLVEVPAVMSFRPLRSYGWAAIELCVQEVKSTHARLSDSPFEIIGPPSPIVSLPTIHPMQVAGPDGEVVFLTEIKRGGPGSGLPTATTPIDVLFIAVLACQNMPLMAEWVAMQLGVSITPALDIPYRTLSRAFGLPADQIHRITTAQHREEIFLEFDQYPLAAAARDFPQGALPPGVAVVSLMHRDLDAIPGPWFARPTRRQGAIYCGRRVGVLAAPEGALFEIVEDSEV